MAKPKMEFLSSISPSTGLDLLRSIGGAPWSMVSHGEMRSFQSSKTDDLERWVEKLQGNARSVLFHLPTHIGAHWFIAARLPLSARPVECNPRAHVIIQSTDWTLLWRLAAPVSTAVAESIARELVGHLGGKPAIGQSIPLPGTFYAAKPGAKAGERVPVLLMRSAGAPLHVEGGRLVAPLLIAAPQVSPFQDASTVQARPIEWLWPNVIPRGSLTLLGGAPGMGKSQAAISIAATLSRGSAWPCGTSGAIGSALVLESEDDIESVITPRLTAAGADLRRVGVGKRLDMSADGLAQLEAERRRRRDLQLVVLSPVREFFGEATEAKGNLALREAMKPLLDWAGEHRITVLGVAHPPKGKENKEAFAGSNAFLEVARAAYSVIPDPDDDNPIVKMRRRVLVSAKSNLSADNVALTYHIEGATVGPIQTSRVVWE